MIHICKPRLWLSLAALVGVVGAAPGSALAQPSTTGDEVRTEVVAYADLDLANPAGQRSLHQRIEAAAHRVCGGDPQSWTDAQEYRGCVQKAVQGALTRVAEAEQARRAVQLAQGGERP